VLIRRLFSACCNERFLDDISRSHSRQRHHEIRERSPELNVASWPSNGRGIPPCCLLGSPETDAEPSGRIDQHDRIDGGHERDRSAMEPERPVEIAAGHRTHLFVTVATKESIRALAAAAVRRRSLMFRQEIFRHLGPHFSRNRPHRQLGSFLL
jgi:hypothetical protein